MSPTAGGGSFVGRRRELDRLRDVRRAVAAGRTQVLIVEGEAGIGKTRLYDEGVKEAVRDGCRTFRAAAEALDRLRPFGVVVDALAPATVEAGRSARVNALLADEARDSDVWAYGGPQTRHLVVEELVSLVGELAAGGPVLLCLEDLQWADQSSLLAVLTLARRLYDLPLALWTSFRPLPSSEATEHLITSLRSLGAEHLVLGSLDDEAVISLITELLRASPGPRLREQAAKAQGNPLFLLEALHAAAAEDQLVPGDDGTVDVDRLDLGPSLRQALLRRLAYLPPEGIDLLRVAAVLGRAFDVEHLGAAMGRSVVELAPVLESLRRAGVIDQEGGRLAFRHQLIQEAVYGELAEPVRLALHAQAGRSLGAASAPSVIVAQHLSLGAHPGDTQAVEVLRAAANDAVASAPEVAVELLERAAALCLEPSTERDWVLAELAAARLWSGQVCAAEEIARQLLHRARTPPLSDVVRLALVHALLAQGRGADAHDVLQSYEPDRSHPSGAQLEALGAWANLFVGDHAAVAVAAQKALDASDRVDDTLAACLAHCALATSRVVRGHPHEALEHARAAVDRSDGAASPVGHRFHSRLVEAFVLLDLDRRDEAAEALHVGRQLSQKFGIVWNLPMYQWGLTWLRFFGGEWDDAVAEAETGLRLADEVGSRDGAVNALSVLAVIALHRNDVASGRELLARGWAELEQRPTQYRAHWLAWGQALAHEMEGQASEAVKTLAGVWEMAAATETKQDFPLFGPQLLRLALAVGRSDLAHSVSTSVEEVAGTMRCDTATAAALRCRGLLESSTELLLEAATVAERAGRPLTMAETREDAGMALAGAGRPTEARVQLVESLRIYERLGGQWDIGRVEAALRSFGLARGRRPRRPQPAPTGWAALTRMETEVARLVGQGLTSPQVASRLYISPRTVETHLGHVFAKLGLRSRTELVAEVVRRRSDPTAAADGPAQPTRSM